MAPSLRQASALPPSPVLWATPTPAPLSPTSRSPAYRVRRSQSTPGLASRGSHCWGGDGPLLFPQWLSRRSTPSTPQGSSVLHLQDLHTFRGLRPGVPGSAPCWPLTGISSRRGRLRLMLRTGGLHSPYESLTPRFDVQLSPNTGGLLRRVLAPPSTGLSPASHRGLSGRTTPY